MYQNSLIDVWMDSSSFRVLNCLRDERDSESGFPCGGYLKVFDEFLVG